MKKKNVLIIGAAGRDFHNFNTYYKDNEQYNVVAFTAAQIPDIDGMVVSTSSAEPMLITFPGLTILPKKDFDLDPEKIYSTNVIAFPQGEEYESLIEVANEVIQKNKEDGTIEQWHADAIKLSREAIDE